MSRASVARSSATGSTAGVLVAAHELEVGLADVAGLGLHEALVALDVLVGDGALPGVAGAAAGRASGAIRCCTSEQCR
jgi:hypothetical protein